MLKAATDYVLTDRVNSRSADPPHFIEPKHFLSQVELAQRLAPWFFDWEIVLKAFAVLAVRRAYLFGRTETDESDYRALGRVARDSIPFWIQKCLGALLEGPSKTPTLEKLMGLEDKTRRSGHGAHRELIRLHRRGVIRYNAAGRTWNLREAYQEGVRRALASQSFE